MTRMRMMMPDILAPVLAALLIVGCHSNRDEPAATAPPTAVVQPQSAPAVDNGAPPRPMVKVQVQPSPGEQELIGKHVRVSLRRDALGLAATSTPEPDANMIAGKQVLLSGTVERFGDGWLVLKGDDDGRRRWIATNVILLIEVQ